MAQTPLYRTSNVLKHVHLLVIEFEPYFWLRMIEHRTSNIVRPITRIHIYWKAIFSISQNQFSLLIYIVNYCSCMICSIFAISREITLKLISFSPKITMNWVKIVIHGFHISRKFWEAKSRLRPIHIFQQFDMKSWWNWQVFHKKSW